MNAVVYTTNTGSTERYAKLLAHETALPAYSLAEAKKKLFPGAEVIYLGWIMAGLSGAMPQPPSVTGCVPSAESAWDKPAHKRTA